MSGDIYSGIWINWSRGAVDGATLTLSNRDGSLLLSFIAAFVTLVGSQLWRILCFLIHQLSSPEYVKDGLHHQRQNVLRNNGSSIGAALSFLQLGWYWRRVAKRSSMRTVPFALLATIYFIVFAVLAVLSSQVAKGLSTARLRRNGVCGVWDPSSDASIERLNAYRQKTTSDVLKASAYARSCYTRSPSGPKCQSFLQPRIPWTLSRNSSCPFRGDLCLDDHVHQMNTGFIDSHHVLGINAPKHHRVSFRKQTTCTPLPTGEAYTTWVRGVEATSLGWSEDVLLRYDYGPTTYTNYTYQYNTYAPYTQFGYHVESVPAYRGVNDTYDGFWTPIAPLQPDSGDVAILFVAFNAIRMYARSEDPVFGAHEYFIDENGEPMYIITDRFVSPIACNDRYWICDPNIDEGEGACTAPVGAFRVLAAAHKDLDLNVFQLAIVQRLALLVPHLGMREQVWTRSGNALRAQDTLAGLDQSPLADNHWEIEVEGWFTDSLARLQYLVDEYPDLAATSTVTDERDIMKVWDSITANSSAENISNALASKLMCYNQLVNDSQTTMSFSVVGLVVIFALGGLILILSLIVESTVAFMQKKTGRGLIARESWIQHDKLQLQKLMFELAGLGQWQGHDNPVPITKEDELLDLRTVLEERNHSDTYSDSGREVTTLTKSDTSREAKGFHTAQDVREG
ncbi:hypothetical protein LTR70_006962 [Exophiala xenobiotica]|uniref:Uncharacterized protein n=1 Tax=Lithohypha guttulata TaxID=1690604 RepID=A0ABR0K5M2_9EURO|nr:hypothetical protein LTR24_006584 [Lithohypha guttulata]KAK5314921.1 hypothetical protein LTR70_006962 [Exophiala xenobiotica]